MTAEYIKEAYDRLRKELGRQPSQSDFYANTNVTAYRLLNAGFRNYSQLVQEMGDTPKSFSDNTKSKEEYFNSYGSLIRELNKIPSTNDWIYSKRKPAMSNYKIKFQLNSWAEMANVFLEYAKDKEEWKDIIYLIPNSKKEIKIIKKKEDNETCYVYLMYDTKSHHYKIGISNDTEWREKTLQSEKPSIKCIAAKKYVNRRIAASFEKALHESYAHKNKRGEWFQLDDEDIKELKETLKD